LAVASPDSEVKPRRVSEQRVFIVMAGVSCWNEDIVAPISVNLQRKIAKASKKISLPRAAFREGPPEQIFEILPGAAVDPKNIVTGDLLTHAFRPG
jgi:hypothetical protein